MKKGLKLTGAIVLMLAVMTGCAGNTEELGITPGMATSELAEEMETSESVDPEQVIDLFATALTASCSPASATINTDVTIEMSQGEETASNRRVTGIKYMDAPGSEATDDTSETGTMGTEIQDNKIALIEVNNEENGESIGSVEGYYQDGKLYYSLDDNKVYEEMSYADLLTMVGDYNLQFESDVVANAYSEVSGKNVAYIVQFDPEAMADMMMNNMMAAGGQFGEDESMSINGAYLYFEIDEEGYLVGFNMEMDAKFVIASATEDEAQSDTATEENPFVYSVTANFTDFDSTQVEAYTDLEDYMDVYTYLEEQEAAAAEETAPQEQADTEVAPQEETVAEETQSAE